MGKLTYEITSIGDVKITTSSGAEYRLTDRGGQLEVRPTEGDLAVFPRSANAVELAVREW